MGWFVESYSPLYVRGGQLAQQCRPHQLSNIANGPKHLQIFKSTQNTHSQVANLSNINGKNIFAKLYICQMNDYWVRFTTQI